MQSQDASGRKGHADDAVAMGMASAREVSGRKWYEGVTAYMWLVLLIGSLGWVFDMVRVCR